MVKVIQRVKIPEFLKLISRNNSDPWRYKTRIKDHGKMLGLTHALALALGPELALEPDHDLDQEQNLEKIIEVMLVMAKWHQNQDQE